MIITVTIKGFVVMNTLVDQGGSVDILYWKTFKKLQIPEIDIQPYNDQIVWFSSERVETRGFIDLYTNFKEGRLQSQTIKIRYLLVKANMSYNVLLGRLGAIMSTPHLAMKFLPTTRDIITVHVARR